MVAWTVWREVSISRHFNSYTFMDDEAMWVPDYGWVYVLVILAAVWMMRP